MEFRCEYFGSIIGCRWCAYSPLCSKRTWQALPGTVVAHSHHTFCIRRTHLPCRQLVWGYGRGSSRPKYCGTMTLLLLSPAEIQFVFLLGLQAERFWRLRYDDDDDSIVYPSTVWSSAYASVFSLSHPNQPVSSTPQIHPVHQQMNAVVPPPPGSAR